MLNSRGRESGKLNVMLEGAFCVAPLGTCNKTIPSDAYATAHLWKLLFDSFFAYPFWHQILTLSCI